MVSGLGSGISGLGFSGLCTSICGRGLGSLILGLRLWLLILRFVLSLA